MKTFGRLCLCLAALTMHQLPQADHIQSLQCQLSASLMRSFMDACGAKCYNEAAEHLREAIKDGVLPMLLSAIQQAAAPAGGPADA